METISMSRRERQRLEVMGRLAAGEVGLAQAAEWLQVSRRQASRIWARYQEEGDEGLVHRARGRPSNRQPDTQLREQVLSVYVEKYHDYGPTLAAESLAESEGLVVPVTTLRRWLLAEGLWQRRRRRKQHRRKRDRRPQRGELLQMDGSHHDWFEGRRAWAVLMVMIDDATSRTYARFFEEETLLASLETVLCYTRRHGLPRALYVDRSGIYRPEESTAEEAFSGQVRRTQFGHAMDELGVELILARSPQAKGRVERMNGTLQDRLVKALRQAGVSDLATANRFLEEQFLEPFNARFSCPAARRGDVHRRPCEEALLRALAIRHERVLQNDWTVRWQRGFLQLPPHPELAPKQRVEVREHLDGSLRVYFRGEELSWTRCYQRERPRRRPKRSGPTGSSQGNKPSKTHAWRGKAAG